MGREKIFLTTFQVKPFSCLKLWSTSSMLRQQSLFALWCNKFCRQGFVEEGHEIAKDSDWNKARSHKARGSDFLILPMKIQLWVLFGLGENVRSQAFLEPSGRKKIWSGQSKHPNISFCVYLTLLSQPQPPNPALLIHKICEKTTIHLPHFYPWIRYLGGKKKKVGHEKIMS